MAGNANSGSWTKKPFRDALRLEITAAGDDQKALREIAFSLIEKARGGDMQAIKELADRIDGKPAQAIIGGDEDDPAVSVVLEVRQSIVDPKQNPHSTDSASISTVIIPSKT